MEVILTKHSCVQLQGFLVNNYQMKILSRYAVLEYLFWLRSTHYLVDDRNKEFCDLLNNCYSTLQVLENDSFSRNPVFKVKLSAKLYVFKQHGPDLVKRHKYFSSEVFALSTSITLIPKLVYQDKLANIVITEELIDYKDFCTVLSELKSTIPDDSILKEIIKKNAEVVKSIHDEEKFNSKKAPKPKYTRDTWGECFKDKSQLWIRDLPTQFIEYFKQPNEYVHYVHHDLKGKNILIKDTEVRVLDWEMSEKGDQYYNLCYIIFEIWKAIIGTQFLLKEIMNPQIFNWVEKYITIFLNTYDSSINRKKLNEMVLKNGTLFYIKSARNGKGDRS